MAESRTFPRAPAAALKRLQVAEQRQRAATKERGLEAEPVCVEGLLLLQRNLCGCKCGDPLDFETPWDEKAPPPGYPVIAHRLARGSRGGHVVGNVFVDRWACNSRDAKPDTTGAASVKRFAVDWSAKEASEEPVRSGRKLEGRSSFGVGQKLKSGQTKWPSRSFGRRG